MLAPLHLTPAHAGSIAVVTAAGVAVFVGLWYLLFRSDFGADPGRQ